MRAPRCPSKRSECGHRFLSSSSVSMPCSACVDLEGQAKVTTLPASAWPHSPDFARCALCNLIWFAWLWASQPSSPLKLRIRKQGGAPSGLVLRTEDRWVANCRWQEPGTCGARLASLPAGFFLSSWSQSHRSPRRAALIGSIKIHLNWPVLVAWEGMVSGDRTGSYDLLVGDTGSRTPACACGCVLCTRLWAVCAHLNGKPSGVF